MCWACDITKVEEVWDYDMKGDLIPLKSHVVSLVGVGNFPSFVWLWNWIEAVSYSILSVTLHGLGVVDLTRGNSP